MQSFENTSLWRSSFGNIDFQGDSDAIASLRNELLSIRARTKFLVDQIPRDIPGLTVHDITHLDALWETASLIAGNSYPLNPAEAFVLGAAILLHDSAMSLAAYPGGLADVQQMPEWRDAVAHRMSLLPVEAMNQTSISSPPENIARAALGDVLRETHALRAEELPFVKWTGPEGTEELLIQDGDLRSGYGHIIGRIAASHWWPAEDLRKLPSRINASGNVPAAWFVNPIKIACLLRVADAAHIDHRRAPRYLRALINPTGESGLHWAFQAKLGKPSTDNKFLVYTGSPFQVFEAEAWWLCYDMISSIDDELRAVQGVLDSKKLRPFTIIAVKGAKSPLAISELIPTKDWTPVDAELQVSDVPSLVGMLGGQHLYGADLTAPVRELLQNAADSIRAKRLLCDTSPASCRIRVALSRTDKEDVLEFEDDGIGMSPNVLTGALLDFGRSFWRGSAVRKEFPGLLSLGLKTTGRFGIGFFSVFMLGDRVTVTSRRFDAAASETHTLDFQKGLLMRPILRCPIGDENLRFGGTKVRVALKTRYDQKGGLLFKGTYEGKTTLADLNEFVARVSPTVDVTIETIHGDKSEVAVTASDWIDGNPENLEARWRTENGSPSESELKAVLPHIRSLRDPLTGKVHGRAAFYLGSRWDSTGVITVGGFRASEIYSILGVILGETETVSRNSARPTVPGEVLRAWATEQANLFSKSNLPGRKLLQVASLVMLCGGDSANLPIAIQDGRYLTAEEVTEIAVKRNQIDVYEGDEIEYDEDDDVGPRTFENDFTVSKSLFLVPKEASSLATIGREQWPASVANLYVSDAPKNCFESFEAALKRAWRATPEYEYDIRVVGELHRTDISRLVNIFTRPIDISDL